MATAAVAGVAASVTASAAAGVTASVAAGVATGFISANSTALAPCAQCRTAALVGGATGACRTTAAAGEASAALSAVLLLASVQLAEGVPSPHSERLS